MREAAHAPTSLGRGHIVLCIVCALGFMVDIGEIQIASALGAIFSTPEHAGRISTLALSVLLSSTYVGAAIGALVFGLLARRISTSPTLALCMGLLAFGSIGAAMSQGIVSLTAMRALSGLAIGAYPPLAIAILSTQLPAKWRGTLTLAVSAAGSLGGPAVVYAARQLTLFPVNGMEGWRIVLLAWGVGAMVTCAGFIAMHKVGGAATRNDVLVSQAHPPESGAADKLAHRLILPALFVLVNWAGVGFPLLSGAILVAKGYDLSGALIFVMAMNFGPVVGILLSSLLIDWITRRDAIFWTLAIGAASLVAFGVGESIWIVAISSVAFSLVLGLNVVLLSLYAAEFYPAARRADSATRLWSMNRVSVAAAPLFLLPFLRSAGPEMLMFFLAAVLGTCAALVRLAPAGHAGKELA